MLIQFIRSKDKLHHKFTTVEGVMLGKESDIRFLEVILLT